MATTSFITSFNTARQEFLRDFPDDEYAQTLSQFTSIDDVYNATEAIQKKQGETRMLRNLAKIQPYLNCLDQYTTVLDTVVQVKPEVLALIWAPVKLLLVVSSTYMKSFTKVIDSMAQFGAALPHFKVYTQLFAQNESIRRVLGLFFRDILDFHSIALKFFKSKYSTVFFESLWPKYSSKFQVILNNIAQHRMMMDSEVTLAHITEAYAARASADDKYKRDQEHDERMEFQSIRNSLSPQLCDAQLERITQRCSIQAGQWLEREQSFSNWQDSSNQTARFLWLSGIPGAGKTFLSSIIIKNLQNRTNPPFVAFIFFNHQTNHDNYTLTTLHSFLFQLIMNKQVLRPVLLHAYENNYRKLTSSPDFVENLLKDILKTSPTTYFVIDGVDEVPEIERSFLLEYLMKLQESRNAKLLISSRAEYDIMTCLRSQGDRLEVHESNSQDIADYVDHRTNSWLSGLDLDTESACEVRRLTKKIAPKSDGMFLYARLVCDALERLGDLDDIKEEVTTLPDGLSEAYARILKRIDQGLSSSERTQARVILEWVSCSIVPITRNEIKRALSVARGKDPYRGRNGLLLDLVQRCGPIIEVIDDRIYFVHFSAKEYLFSSESDQYLRVTESNSAIAETCLKYLSSDCFNSELSDEAISDGIIRGVYVMQDYAASYWLEHVLRGPTDRKSGCPEHVSRLVKEMIELRENLIYEGSYTGRAPLSCLKIFEEDEPEIFESLMHVYLFLQRRWREFSLADGESWVNEDPLTISATQWRVHKLLEAAFCPSSDHRQGCECAAIQRQYGSRPFKCNRLGCPFFRTGFVAKSDRDRHLRVHDRPYKCDRPDCDFSRMGFGSQARLNVHLQHHEKRAKKSVARPANIDHNEDDVELILIDAVKANDLDLVRDFTVDITKFSEKLLRKAVESSSCEMLGMLLEACGSDPNIESTILAHAVRADNLGATRILLNRGAPVNSTMGGFPCMTYAMMNTSPEMIKILLSYESAQSYPTESLINKDLCCMIPWVPTRFEEARVIQCLSLLRDWTKERHAFETCFKINAKRGCSIAIAEFLLRNGVDINTQVNRGYSALLEAAKRKDQRSAEMMKFLLESGADPHMKSRLNINIADRPGPRNISKWLGISWEQLVEESRKKYAASLESKAQ